MSNTNVKPSNTNVKPRVIVVGTSFGGRVHVPALQAAGFDVIALVGRDLARTQARAKDLGVKCATTSLREALDLGTDAVTVSTPPDSHVDLILEAIATGAHVLCEKPFALNANDGQRMADAAAAAGVVNFTSFEFRWAPLDAAVGRAVAAGAIGEVRLATFVQISSLVANGLHAAFNDDWWFDASRGGGILNAAAPHNIDRFRTWVGEVNALSARLDVLRPTTKTSGDAEDTYTVSFDMDSGATANMAHCAGASGEPTYVFKLVGTTGTITVGRDTATIGRPGQEVEILPIDDDLALAEVEVPTDDPKHAFTFMELPPFIKLAERFRDAISHNDASWSPPGQPPSPTFADALATQRIVDAIRESSRQNAAWVSLSPDSNQR